MKTYKITRKNKEIGAKVRCCVDGKYYIGVIKSNEETRTIWYTWSDYYQQYTNSYLAISYIVEILGYVNKLGQNTFAVQSNMITFLERTVTEKTYKPVNLQKLVDRLDDTEKEQLKLLLGIRKPVG